MPTHFDLLAVMTVFSCFGFTLLAIALWMVWDSKRSAQKSFAELQRMTKAVAGLVVQESNRIRRLMRED
jgi:hypothetical protein